MNPPNRAEHEHAHMLYSIAQWETDAARSLRYIMQLDEVLEGKITGWSPSGKYVRIDQTWHDVQLITILEVLP